ncbi:MAG TPA: serine/threonine-protein kinase [Gemmatimonadaceae bacterium]|nr:serine/threonine-protein kinase [Gemmatimonadaceae bacterium]
MTEVLDRLQSALGADYRIERELGGGGMSRVFLATEIALKREVVIKVLPPELTSDVMTARFKRELEVTAGLQHPHILPVLASGAREGLLYYITPFVQGESLRKRLQRDVKLSVEDTVAILSELASALGYAHERGVVHRDIKPENVLLSGGHAVLADFGIAAVTTSDAQGAPQGTRLTDVGLSMGTPGYMSPEQATGETLDGRSDLYSLAIVGFEMLTGEPPFTGASPMSVITKHLTEPPPNVQSRRGDVPTGLAAALERALAKRPADRFQTAQEFRTALGARYDARPARRDHMLRWAAAAVAGVALVALGFILTRRGERTPGVDANLVAIAPFDVFDASYEMWREGLVDVLAANLDGAGPLRSVSPAFALRRWKAKAAQRETATEFARGLNAGIVVFGRVMAAGRDTVRIEAHLVDAANNRVIGDVQVRDDISRMDRIADSLSLRILAELGQSRAIGLVRRGTIGSTSVPAIKAYLQGTQFYRRSEWDSAAAYFERAVAMDTNFAPALRMLSNALSWHGQGGGPAFIVDFKPYALRAGEKNVGLAPRESVLVATDSIFSALSERIGDPASGDTYTLAGRLFSLLEDAAERFPEDPEIWFKLGDARFHFRFFHPSTQTLADTRAAFDRAVALDSTFAPSYIHLVQVLNQLDDVDAMRLAMQRFLALEPGGEQAEGFRVATKLLDPKTPRDPKSLGALFSSADRNAMGTVYGTVLFLNDTAETQVTFARVMRGGIDAGSVPAQFAPMARLGAAQGLLVRGHLREALEVAPTYMSLIAQAGLVGVLPVDSVDRAVAGGLSRARAGNMVVVGSDPPNNDAFQAALLWYTMRGNRAGAQRTVDAIRRSSRVHFPAPLASGVIALASHDTASAIRYLTMPDSMCLTWCLFARFHVARLLAARGDDAAAAKLYDQDYNVSGVTRVMWMLDRGRVNQRLGNRQKAIDSYAYVVAAWHRPDAELQPFVDEARRGLAALRSDAPRQ